MAVGRHPIYGLLTYVGEFYVHPPSRWWGEGLLMNVRWSLLAAAVTVIAIFLHRTAEPGVPLTRSGLFRGFVVLVTWIALQSFWALDPESHADLLGYDLKFIVVMYMICRCVDSEAHLRYFLWAHVLGCFYLGWLAFTSYEGGRLDGVGGPGINEANAAALQMVTGIFVAASLMLASAWKGRAALLGMIPIMLNGLVTTISRSGFLAVAAGGLVYNLFTPKKRRRMVRVLSVLAAILFLMLTNDTYWQRIYTIKYKGAEVEGVDTGGGRLEILGAQVKMFESHPMGCGHMCTTALSPSYLDQRFLTVGGRASHNTFMTMLVDHGVIGGIIYILMLVWIYRVLRVLYRRLDGDESFLSAVLPAMAAVVGAITVGDMFAQFPKYEARIWFLSLLVVLLHLTDRNVARGRPVAAPRPE